MLKPMMRGWRATQSLKTIVLARGMLADTDTAMAMLAPILRGWRATRVMETTVLIVVVVLVLH